MSPLAAAAIVIAALLALDRLRRIANAAERGAAALQRLANIESARALAAGDQAPTMSRSNVTGIDSRRRDR